MLSNNFSTHWMSERKKKKKQTWQRLEAGNKTIIKITEKVAVNKIKWENSVNLLTVQWILNRPEFWQ